MQPLQWDIHRDYDILCTRLPGPIGETGNVTPLQAADSNSISWRENATSGHRHTPGPFAAAMCGCCPLRNTLPCSCAQNTWHDHAAENSAPTELYRISTESSAVFAVAWMSSSASYASTICSAPSVKHRRANRRTRLTFTNLNCASSLPLFLSGL